MHPWHNPPPDIVFMTHPDPPPPAPGPPPGHLVMPPMPPPGPPGPPPRVRRGDVRLALLTLLGEEPKNGYQMIQEIEARSRGVWRPSPGSVYPALQQLEDEGMVAGDEAGGSRTYRLTEQGRRHLADRDGGVAPWDEVAGSVPEDGHELRMLWSQLNEAFVHLTHTANERQLAQFKKLLKQTRKSIFQILAED